MSKHTGFDNVPIAEAPAIARLCLKAMVAVHKGSYREMLKTWQWEKTEEKLLSPSGRLFRLWYSEDVCRAILDERGLSPEESDVDF